jgi:nucleotide-binding universal stress UspA family protein
MTVAMDARDVNDPRHASPAQFGEERNRLRGGTCRARLTRMMPFKHVLIATDFSEAAEAAQQLGGALAKQLGARTTLLHVLPHTAGTRLLREPYALWAAMIDREEQDEEVKVALEKAAQQLPMEAEVHVIWGHAVEAMYSYAADHDVDLIVLGAHGRSSLGTALIGSIAERVARRAGCAVLVARGQGALPKSILMGTDLSKEAVSGVDAGIALGVSCGSDLTLAHVHVGSGPRAELVSDEADRVLRQKLQQLCESRPVPIQSRLLIDEHPVGGLCRYADESGADLIVVTAQGLSAMERMLIGSVSERLVRHADCSVLVVR